jgi:uncharacterized membrane protein
MQHGRWQKTLGCLPFGATAQGGMSHFWEVDIGWLVLWVGILAALLTIAWYIIGKTRPKSAQKELPANEWLAKCRELHSKGVLSDEEFRTIKTQLVQQLQDELNDNGKKG